jgi:hypothetical protein
MKALFKFKSKYRHLVKSYKLIPNVAEYTTELVGYHLTALLYGIEKVIRKVYVRKLNKGEYNEYLERQMLRLSKYAVEGQLEKYLYLADILMTKSVSYRCKMWNEVDRNVIHRSPAEIDRIWRKITKLCESRSSNLNYKRVWISDPGKSEKYTRPLGVPTLEWRINSRMKLDIIERWFKGQGLLAPWQHGGRSGKGTLSCYKEVLPKYLQYKNIFEFDIKGFFNNISHEVITSLFEKYFNKKIIKGFLNTKPKEYLIPPESEDKGLIDFKNQAAMEEVMDFQPIADTYDFYEERVHAKAWFYLDQSPEMEDEINRDPDPYFQRNREERSAALDWQYEIAPELSIIDTYGNSMEGKAQTNVDLDELIEESEGVLTPGLLALHKSKIGISKVNYPNYLDRALGRDNWKGLGQEGKGVPQGLGTSPFLSTVTTDLELDKIMPKGSITMYMDDGLLFSNEDINTVVGTLQDGLKRLGLEMAPEKSSLVKSEGRWLKTLKFLGMRYDGETNELMSDTRRGTKVKFPERLTGEQLYEWIGNNTELWEEVKKTYTRQRTVKLSTWETGLKTGILGTMIANSQYKNMAPMWLRKLEIERGKLEAWKRSRQSDSVLLWPRQFVPEEQTLTNLSSIFWETFLLLKSKKMTVKRYSRIQRGQLNPNPLNIGRKPKGATYATYIKL